MKKIKLIIYYLIISKLPNSWFPGGKIYNNLRLKFLKGIIRTGENCRIQSSVYIGNGNDIKIGNNCQINELVRLDNVEIGNNVMIARESIILGKMHESKDIDIPMSEQGVRGVKKTIIEDDVWIGLRVIIMPGVIVKKGSIIAACAVVTRDTEEYGVYGGVPAKLIKKRQI